MGRTYNPKVVRRRIEKRTYNNKPLVIEKAKELKTEKVKVEIPVKKKYEKDK